MTQFLTQEEEFELLYSQDLEVLNDIEDVVENNRRPIPVGSPPKTQPRPSTSYSTDFSLLGGDTPYSQISHPALGQGNPVSRRLFGATASTPFTAKRTENPEVVNQLNSIGLNENNRKRRLNDLFGDIQDIDELSEIDFDHLAKKPKSEEEIDLEIIQRILCLRKQNQASNTLEKNNSLDRFKAWHYRKMQNLSYKEPNWPFVIMRCNEQRVFVRFHSEDFEADEINEIGIQHRQEASILGEFKQQVWQEAQELVANRLITEPAPVEEISVPNVVVEENLWVEKYRPRRYIDLLSDESTNRSLLQWLKLWDKVVFGRETISKIKPNNSNNTKFNTFNRKAGTFQPGGWNRNNKMAPNKELDEIGRPVQKVALLCGPPGLGKTTLAHILALHAGYAVREMNASDDRSVDAFRQTLENGTQMQSMLNENKRPNCIILDEIDGAPQPSIDFLIRFVQDSAGPTKGKKKDGKKGFLLKRPIICICNDMYAPALRQLRQIAFVVNFPPITSEKLAERLLYLSRKEHIKTDMTALLSLAEKTGNDVRSCISMLQFYGGLKKPLMLVDVLKSNIGQKDRHRGLFNVWNAIFQIQRPKNVLQKESDTVTLSDMSETTRMETVTQAVHSGGDYERVMQGVYENYLRQKVSDASMLRTSEALVWFCFNDRIQHLIAHQQNYSVYPYLQYGFVAWHFLFASLAWPKITFPTKSYEAFQKGTTVKMILTSLKKGIHPSCTAFGADNETLLNSIPLIKRIICPQLRSVSVQLLSPKEKSDLKHAIAVMCDMGICYNQIKAADGTYQFVLEPDLELVSNFTEINSPQLNYWTKQLIARESDLEKVRRAAPTYTDKVAKKKTVDTQKEKPTKNVMKPSSSELPNHLQTLQAKSIKNKKETVLEAAVEENEEDHDIDLLFSSDSSDSEEGGEHAKIPNFLETIEKYSDRDFKEHFRLNRVTVLELIEKYSTYIGRGISSGHPMLDRNVDIYMYLWYLSNTVTFRQLGNLFGVAKSTAWHVIVRVSDFFMSISNEYLRWPTHEESKYISNKFEAIKKIPNVIGAIDGTHIKINAPIEHAEDYYNRKQYYSISLQLVVDANKKIYDVHCGEPGSMHDARVLRRSALFQRVEQNTNLFFPPNTFLLGDSAYPLKSWLIPPYRDNGALTDVQRQFNFLHSSTRIVVENAIGMLKSRFRRLLNFTEQRDLKLLQKVVYSACVLHNICIMQNDDITIDSTVVYSEPNVEAVNLATDNTINRRELLLEELIRKRIL